MKWEEEQKIWDRHHLKNGVFMHIDIAPYGEQLWFSNYGAYLSLPASLN